MDTLDLAGGELLLDELYGRLNPGKSPEDKARWRPRDLRRRTLPMLEASGILTVEGDVVRMTARWLEALEDARELGREIEAEENARKRLELKRRAFHRRHEIESDPAPTPEDLEAQRERFKAALKRQKRAREEEMRAAALEAFCSRNSGAARNLALFMDGEFANVQALVQSVLHYHGVPVVKWGRTWERWRDPVLEAAASFARERAPGEPGLRRDDTGQDHPLSCECPGCVSPAPRYARPYGRRSA